jgi:hypothetical protein
MNDVTRVSINDHSDERQFSLAGKALLAGAVLHSAHLFSPEYLHGPVPTQTEGPRLGSLGFVYKLQLELPPSRRQQLEEPPTEAAGRLLESE